MVVCKFFQEGYCRYGQNCRFEHVYGSKYSYHANTNPPAQAAPQASSGVTDEQLMQQVQSDIQAALKGGQWLLSCYAPYKEKPIFPGLSDLSPEEARLFIYEAKASNNIEQAVAYINNLSKETRSKYEQLLSNAPSIVKVLRSLYNGEASSSPFGQTQTFTQSDTSSIFGGNQQNAQSIFAQANRSHSFSNTGNTAQSIFSQASQSVFGAPAQNQSPFGADAKSIFAQANRSPFETQNQSTPFRSPFESQTQSQSQSTPFKSPFEQPSPFAQPNVFQKSEPSSVFGQANVFQQAPLDDPGVYSNMNDLLAEDVDMFKSASFKLGFIPEVPPPHSLCI